MEFVSIEFVCFLTLSVICVRLSPPRWRSHVLLVASYLFYCTWNWRMAALLFAATGASYLAALQVKKNAAHARATLTFAIVSLLILVLIFFKLRPLLHAQGNIAIPLGLSYYTFRLVGYLLDVYWGKCEPVQEFVPFAAYVAFFPHIIAGPIQRASSFIPQFRNVDAGKFRTLEGLLRIAIGFAKKSIVADNLGLFVGWAYSHLSAGSAVPGLVALYLYPLQLYADFSGLTDIAIGSGLLLGIEAPENFDAPFSAKSITEFWRRWHMTLTAWLRDYVFIPLRMVTRDWGKFGLAFSLTINMLLIGLWHGVTAGFVAYGLLQAVFLVFEAFTVSKRQRFYDGHPTADRIADWLGPIYVFQVIAFGTLCFRAPSFGSIAQLFAGLGSDFRGAAANLAALTQPPNHHAWIALPAFALITLADAYRRRHGFALPAVTPRYVRWSVYSGVTTMWLLIAMTLLASERGADPFVYGLF
jgi:alginate O-acetyltransferase complex protein AlgI